MCLLGLRARFELLPAREGDCATSNVAWPRASVALLRTWWQRQRSRRELAQMDDRMLRDIGVSRSRALAEASKPFWRA
jgi:uncharacterized protein YjiS (DUF1127 family)